MTEGIRFLGSAIYAHELDCAALLDVLRSGDERRRRERQRVASLRYAHVPEDGIGIGDLEGYVRRFGIREPFAGGIELARGFVAAFDNHQQFSCGFALRGEKGSGKSTLVAAMSRSIVQRGISLRFESAPELYNHLLGASQRGALEEEIAELVKVSVLVLDDLAREKASAWWVDQCLFPIIDGRYRNGRPIVATSNRDWSAAEARWQCRGGASRDGMDAADSATVIRDRLQERCPSFEFGPRESLRRPGLDFMR